MFNFTKKLKGNKKGFSLIELLIIIFVISLLSSAATYFLGGAKEKSRDFQRISDVETIQNALGMYFVDHGYYPEAITEGESIVADDGSNTVYLKKVPTAPPVPDPANNTEGYNYTRDASKTSYTISYYLAKEIAGKGNNNSLFGNCVANPDSECYCVASCDGKDCGDDGCGGSCGTCSNGLTCNVNTCATFAGGDGTSGSPYQIATCVGLQAMQDSPSSYYILNNDIDCSDTSSWNSDTGFAPVGNSSTKFTGVLDGAEYTISDLYINRSSTDYVGLFGYANGATITDLSLTGVNITGQEFVGSLAGEVDGSTITSVSSAGEVTGTSKYIGGIIGYIHSSAISRSSTNVSMTGGVDTGGFAGLTSNASTITDSYSVGNVGGSTSNNRGGFIGRIADASISRCYSSGDISNGNSNVGGFSGYSYAGASITNCFSSGSVSGNFTEGGFIGYNDNTTLSGIYWDKTRSGQIDCYSGGDTDCTAKNTTGTPDPSYWYSSSNAPMSNWDFTNVWQTTATYPTLR